MSMNLVVPPSDASLDEIHKYLLSHYTWTKQMFLTGTQVAHMTNVEIAAMVSANDLAQSGKTVYNTDTNLFEKLYINAGMLQRGNF